MLTDDQRTYMLKRERECIAAAGRTVDRSVSRVHQDFARTYRDVLDRDAVAPKAVND